MKDTKIAQRDSRLWQDSTASSNIFEGDTGECNKWLGFAKQKLQFMLHNNPGPLSSRFFPADGVEIKIDTRPNRIQISTGGVVVTFGDIHTPYSTETWEFETNNIYGTYTTGSERSGVLTGGTIGKTQHWLSSDRRRAVSWRGHYVYRKSKKYLCYFGYTEVSAAAVVGGRFLTVFHSTDKSTLIVRTHIPEKILNLDTMELIDVLTGVYRSDVVIPAGIDVVDFFISGNTKYIAGVCNVAPGNMGLFKIPIEQIEATTDTTPQQAYEAGAFTVVATLRPPVETTSATGTTTLIDKHIHSATEARWEEFGSGFTTSNTVANDGSLLCAKDVGDSIYFIYVTAEGSGSTSGSHTSFLTASPGSRTWGTASTSGDASGSVTLLEGWVDTITGETHLADRVIASGGTSSTYNSSASVPQPPQLANTTGSRSSSSSSVSFKVSAYDPYSGLILVSRVSNSRTLEAIRTGGSGTPVEGSGSTQISTSTTYETVLFGRTGSVTLNSRTYNASESSSVGADVSIQPVQVQYPEGTRTESDSSSGAVNVLGSNYYTPEFATNGVVTAFRVEYTEPPYYVLTIADNQTLEYEGVYTTTDPLYNTGMPLSITEL